MTVSNNSGHAARRFPSFIQQNREIKYLKEQRHDKVCGRGICYRLEEEEE
jgi:hypothetical protein